MSFRFLKIFAVTIIILAVVLAIFGISLPRSDLPIIIAITNFFDIMLPVVSFGAYTLLILFIVKKW